MASLSKANPKAVSKQCTENPSSSQENFDIFWPNCAIMATTGINTCDLNTSEKSGVFWRACLWCSQDISSLFKVRIGFGNYLTDCVKQGWRSRVRGSAKSISLRISKIAFILNAEGLLNGVEVLTWTSDTHLREWWLIALRSNAINHDDLREWWLIALRSNAINHDDLREWWLIALRSNAINHDDLREWWLIALRSNAINHDDLREWWLIALRSNAINHDDLREWWLKAFLLKIHISDDESTI